MVKRDGLFIKVVLEQEMIRPQVAKWNQSVSDLCRLSVEAEHPRTRERFLALDMIASKQMNATRWAAESGREVVIIWDGAPWHRARYRAENWVSIGVRNRWPPRIARR